MISFILNKFNDCIFHFKHCRFESCWYASQIDQALSNSKKEEIKDRIRPKTISIMSRCISFRAVLVFSSVRTAIHPESICSPRLNQPVSLLAVTKKSAYQKIDGASFSTSLRGDWPCSTRLPLSHCPKTVISLLQSAGFTADSSIDLRSAVVELFF